MSHRLKGSLSSTNIANHLMVCVIMKVIKNGCMATGIEHTKATRYCS